MKTPVRETGSSRLRGENAVTIGSLTDADADAIRAMIQGACWVRVDDDGRIERRDRFEPLPALERDAAMVPFWTNYKVGGRRANVRRFDLEEVDGWHSPAIFVQHISAGDSTPDAYQRAVRRFERYGFACMRSRRGDEGKYWEVWYLPFLAAAGGELKQAIDAVEDTAWQLKLEAAVRFLCRNCSFGSLDVAVQRAALVYD